MIDPSQQQEEENAFREGLSLFNQGEWFEAHEVWEDAWRATTGNRKMFYQGLIQCAVVLEHARRGNPRGMRSVWETAQTKFVNLPKNYMGVALDVLMREMADAIKPILDLPEEYFDPARGRAMDLPVSLNNPPTISLTYDPFGDTHLHRNDAPQYEQ